MWERNVLLRRIVFVVAVTLSGNLKNAPHFGGAMPPPQVGRKPSEGEGRAKRDVSPEHGSAVRRDKDFPSRRPKGRRQSFGRGSRLTSRFARPSPPPPPRAVRRIGLLDWRVQIFCGRGKKYYLGCSLVNRDAVSVLFISSAVSPPLFGGLRRRRICGKSAVICVPSLQASSQNAADLTMERKSRINLAAQRVEHPHCPVCETAENIHGYRRAQRVAHPPKEPRLPGFTSHSTRSSPTER